MGIESRRGSLRRFFSRRSLVPPWYYFVTSTVAIITIDRLRLIDRWWGYFAIVGMFVLLASAAYFIWDRPKG